MSIFLISATTMYRSIITINMLNWATLKGLTKCEKPISYENKGEKRL